MLRHHRKATVQSKEVDEVRLPAMSVGDELDDFASWIVSWCPI